VSDRRLLLAITGCCLAGVGVAGYLTYVHYAGLHPLCLSSGGCERVQSSQYAKLGDIPVPLIGIFGYLSILGSLLMRGEAGRGLTALLAMIGFGVSAYLTYLELFQIHAICQWCVASAVLMTALAVLSGVRLVRGPASQGMQRAGYPS
jgi:uncharacterized membrane protein